MTKTGSGSQLSHPMIRSKPAPTTTAAPRVDQQVRVVGAGADAPSIPDDVMHQAQIDLDSMRKAELPDFQPSFDDPLVQQQLLKRDTFERLLSFRKPTTKDVTIDGLVYRFKILNPHETSSVIKLFLALPEDEQLNLRERMLLMSAGLMTVNGFRLEDVYVGPEVEDVLKKYAQLSEWPYPLVNHLLREFNEFISEVREKYLPDFLAQRKAESKG
jgi:hypothetical protein